MARVRARLPDLHPTERRLAEAVLDFPGDMAGYTATEIAEHAGVSNATVSRFVRKIGYGSFEEARRAVRDEQRAGAALVRFGSQGTAGGTAEAHLEQSRLNLEQTYAALAEGDVDGLAQALLAARRVWVAGFRAGYPLARYLAWQIEQVIETVTLLPRSGETLADSAARIDARDVAIFVALRRAPRVLGDLAESARQAGCTLAVIGDLPDLDRLGAAWTVRCATTARGPLLNHVSVMAACNLIAARTIDLSGLDGRRRMAAAEEAHGRFGEL